MRSTRPIALVLLCLALLVVAVPAAGQDATPAATPAGTPEAVACSVDPIDPIAYGEAALAASDPGERRSLDEAQPADEATTAAARELIEMSIACTNAGDMSRLLALTDPAFAPSMLGTDRAEIQPEIDRAVAEAPPAGETGPPLREESDNQPVTPTLLGIGDVFVYPDGLVAVTVEIDSLQTSGRVEALVYLRPVGDGYLIFDWYVP